MNIIKLNAINSTNGYLKKMCDTVELDNFTVVTAEAQLQGRGQRGAQWHSQAGKNLTFSILIKYNAIDVKQIFTLNVMVAVSILEMLHYYNISKVSVKWPNDILAGNKKLGGVLIENTIKSNGCINSVIGIGLNVNQKEFNGIEKAGSLFTVMGKEYDKDEILLHIVNMLKQNMVNLEQGHANMLWEKYHDNLFKKEIPMPFEKDNQKFMGIIKGVAKDGMLALQHEDDTIVYYGIKEIKMLY